MMVPFLFVPTLQLLRCNRQTLHHFNILCRSDVPAADLDKALDRVSAYYHKYIDKGRLPTEAYAKVLKRFPDAVFHCYTYPKVIFATTLQQLCILTLHIALQRTEKYKLRSMTMMGGAQLLEAITAPSASDDFSDSDDSSSESGSGSSDSESESETTNTGDVSNRMVTKLLQCLCNAFSFKG